MMSPDDVSLGSLLPPSDARVSLLCKLVNWVGVCVVVGGGGVMNSKHLQ